MRKAGQTNSVGGKVLAIRLMIAPLFKSISDSESSTKLLMKCGMVYFQRQRRGDQYV
jgi:hypothetical protein